MAALLRANPAFRLLWTARTASYVGDSLGLVALLIYLEISTGQALAVAFLLVAADFVPGFAGAVGDRFDLRRVLVTCEVTQGLLTLLIAVLLPPLPVLLLLVCLRGLAAQVFQPASRSAVPALVPDRDLEAATSALGAGTFGLEALGPLLAAALLPLLGTRGLLLADTATFAGAAVLLALLPRMPRPATENTGARAGLDFMWTTPAVRAIGLGFVGVVMFSGVDDVALVFLARDDLGAGDAATALLYAGIGIGLAAGYPLIARLTAQPAGHPRSARNEETGPRIDEHAGSGHEGPGPQLDEHAGNRHEGAGLRFDERAGSENEEAGPRIYEHAGSSLEGAGPRFDEHAGSGDEEAAPRIDERSGSSHQRPGPRLDERADSGHEERSPEPTGSRSKTQERKNPESGSRRRNGHRTSLALVVGGFAVSSAGNLLTGLAWAVGAALVLQTVRGLGVAALDVGVNTHLQRVVPDGLLGRVFGTLYGAVGVAAGVSYVLGGVLLALTGARTTFVVAGVGGLLVTALSAAAVCRRGRP